MNKDIRFYDILFGEKSPWYIYQKDPYEEKIKKASFLIENSDVIIIGAGSGLSTAAGLSHSGKRFEENFSEYINKYTKKYFPDMYNACFYPFSTEEEKWGYFSKLSLINRFIPPALPLYKKLYELVSKKDYFVLTTNVDHQFQKSGFDENKIFATQGDYGEIQCSKNCHNKAYQAEELFYKMDRERKDCLIPSYLVPTCPICNGSMEMHLRIDINFAEDENFHKSLNNYVSFLSNNIKKKVALIELGAGFSTPSIIRFPFEKLARENEEFSFIRINKREPLVPECINNRAVSFPEDMLQVIDDLIGARNE